MTDPKRQKPQQAALALGDVDAERPMPELIARALPASPSFARGDAFEFLRGLPDASVDLLVTDPPYESLELHRSKGTTTRLTADWFQTVPDAKLPELLAETFRVLKPDRHFYLFCDEITADVIKAQQGITTTRDKDGARPCKSGFRYWRELIWAKTTQDGTRIAGGMGYHYRSASERILFFEKGKRKLNDLGVPDVLTAPRPEYKAPAGKPAAVLETLIRESTEPGEVVVDPFAGSGVAGLAAAKLRREFWLNDLDDSYLLPEVRKLVEPRGLRFLYVEPHLAEPSALLDALMAERAEDDDPPPEVQHDMEMLRLDTDAGRALVARLRALRPVERVAPFRRHLRASAWLKSARFAAEDDQRRTARLEAWLRWLDG